MRNLGRSIKKFSADDMLVYASAVSYQVFFSLFPFITCRKRQGGQERSSGVGSGTCNVTTLGPNFVQQSFCELRQDGVLRSPHSPDPIRQALRRAYRGLGAWDDHRPPNAVTGVKLVYGRRRRYLRLVARLSEALDVTEVAHIEARCLLDCL
jgi:hypothetical protein